MRLLASGQLVPVEALVGVRYQPNESVENAVESHSYETYNNKSLKLYRLLTKEASLVM